MHVFHIFIPKRVKLRHSWRGCKNVSAKKGLNRAILDQGWFELNADVHASRNILATGHAVFACGEVVSPHDLEGNCFLNHAAASLKQEQPSKLPRKRQQAGIPVL